MSRTLASASARWCTQRLCLEVARQLRMGARGDDIAILLVEAVEAARLSSQLEGRVDG